MLSHSVCHLVFSLYQLFSWLSFFFLILFYLYPCCHYFLCFVFPSLYLYVFCSHFFQLPKLLSSNCTAFNLPWKQAVLFRNMNVALNELFLVFYSIHHWKRKLLPYCAHHNFVLKAPITVLCLRPVRLSSPSHSSLFFPVTITHPLQLFWCSAR